MKKHSNITFQRLIKGAFLSVLLLLSACSVENAVDRIIDRVVERVLDLDDELSACLPETEAKAFAESAVDELLNEGLSFTASASEVPYYRFSIDQPQAITITAMGESADPSITLFDSQGNNIQENDDFGEGYNSRIPLNEPLDPGTYCISVNALEDDDHPINLSLKTFIETDLETDNLTACLPETEAKTFSESGIDQLLEEGLSFTASVSETPFYRFSIDHPQAITISSEGESADPTLTLYDSQGNDIAENDDYGDSYNSKMNFKKPLEAGVYCIGVGAIESDFISIRTSIEVFDERSIDHGSYDLVDEVPPLDGSYPISTFVYSDNRASTDVTLGEKAIWYRIDVNAPSIFFFEANAMDDSEIDPELSLFDIDGIEVAYNDDGLGTDSLLAARLEPATYLLALSQAEETDSELVQVLVERYAKTELK